MKMAESSSPPGKSNGGRAGKGTVSANQAIAGQQEQGSLASKAIELKLESNKHSLVIDILKEVDETHQGCHMFGGMLVERIAKEVHSF
jgi:hypothetical protein